MLLRPCGYSLWSIYLQRWVDKITDPESTSQVLPDPPRETLISPCSSAVPTTWHWSRKSFFLKKSPGISKWTGAGQQNTTSRSHFLHRLTVCLRRSNIKEDGFVWLTVWGYSATRQGRPDVKGQEGGVHQDPWSQEEEAILISTNQETKMV